MICVWIASTLPDISAILSRVSAPLFASGFAGVGDGSVTVTTTAGLSVDPGADILSSL